MFRSLAATGNEQFDVRTHALPNHAVIDYLLDGSLAPIIAQGGWKYIVIQQGPTTLPICRDTLIIAAKQIGVLGQKVGARVVSMMSWPTISRQFDFPKVHQSALMAAHEADGIFAPVGDAWQIALAANPGLQIYGDDGYHPGIHGTYLAALVIYEQVTGKDARDLPSDAPVYGGAISIPAQIVVQLQNAAHQANQNARGEVAPPWTQVNPPPPPITC